MASANLKKRFPGKLSGLTSPYACTTAFLLATSFLSAPLVYAQETVCARVKIEIKQELTLERQAFDAEMKIHNTTDTGVIENVSIVVKVTDENGTPIAVTDNPNDLSAKFFVRVSSKENIVGIDGTGTVNPKTTSKINWILIPAPGSAGTSPLGKKYLVGATLKYKFGGEETVLDVAPDVITVKPLPLLTLDYFLPRDVWADDPLTSEIEAIEPFTLGVRVKNTGQAAAKNLKIDSAQPKIIENNQGLLINFKLTSSYVNDAPAQNTLLINFGDIAAGSSMMGRWNMETTLAGTFTEFTARFSHADELGGALTSILQATNAHTLIHDVRVDLPGRDYVRDFLAQDGDVVRIYESDAPDTEVTDRSSVATLTAGTTLEGNASYRLNFPATAGFVYLKLPDPFKGVKAVGKVVRSDAKALLSENVWLSKTRNAQSKQWEYWVNVFDVNTTGVYNSEFQAPPAVARAPAWQFIPDRVTKENKQVSFLVEASSPDAKPLLLSASPLPTGATFTQQAPDLQSPGVVRGVFDWTPAKGSIGTYLINYVANDGTLSASRSATIKVESGTVPGGPGAPVIESPLSGAQVVSLKPTLSVRTASDSQDPTTKVQFEVYADEAQTQVVASSLVDKAPAAPGNGGGTVAAPTQWILPNALSDNTRYWWRTRASGGNIYSPWVNGQFFVNTFNDAPDAFSLFSPKSGASVYIGNPQLSWANAKDKEGDRVTYSVFVYTDAALNTIHTSVAGLPESINGVNSWSIDKALTVGQTYYWRVIARDSNGAETLTPARLFVAANNQPPSVPKIISPALNARVTNNVAKLIVENAIDQEGDTVTYEFELDREAGFTSASKRISGVLPAGSGGQTEWSASTLSENTWYFWRVRASDKQSDSGWQAGKFFVSVVNDAPLLPSVLNPGANAWLATANPLLELNAAIDPEGDEVRYYFQIGTHPSEGGIVASGDTNEPKWRVSKTLSNATTYWWRYRVADTQGASSSWSAWSSFTVNTQEEQVPSLQLTEPAVAMVPELVNGKKIVTLSWESSGVSEEAGLSLYYSTKASSATGTRIVEGLRQAVGTRTGSYTWDVTDLPSGTYYITGQLYTTKQSVQAVAPGAIVIPPAVPSGGLQVKSGTGSTDENGKAWTIQVRLNSAPLSEVVIPIASSNAAEGIVQPAKLTFTAQNWSAYQAVTVKGLNDCLRDGNQKYSISIGKAQSLDSNFIGVSAASIPMINFDNGPITSSSCVKNK